MNVREAMSAEQRALVVEACESLLGTPFVYQGRLPNVGIDCGGLVVLAGEAAGAKPKDNTVYPPRPWPRALERHLDQALLRRELPLEHVAGRVVLWWVRNQKIPTHLGVLRGDGYVYHTNFEVNRVCVNRLDEHWAERVYAQYDYPSEEWQDSF